MAMFLQLGLGLILLAAQYGPGAAVPSSVCRRKCGNVDIPYPFGIDPNIPNCSLGVGFDLSCEVQGGVSRPFRGAFEVLNISLTNSTVRVLNYILGYCYNTSTESMEYFGRYRGVNKGSPSSPYRVSNIQNRFTVIGCCALALMSDYDITGYRGYGVATCRNLSDLVDGACSGIGCSQTTIPKRIYYYRTEFQDSVNTSQSQTWKFSPCSYAVVMEASQFRFSAEYISTKKFNDTYGGRAPMIFDWAIRDTKSCDVAKQNKTGTYACLSSNGMCVDSINDLGYMCNCTRGYEGNPYLPGGCKDVNECYKNPCPSDGFCRNTVGGRKCSCRAGKKYSKKSNTCNPDTSLILGVTIGSFGLMIIIIIIVFWVQMLTDKSDVYSFGVILLEILTGQLPLKLEGCEKPRSLSLLFLSAMKKNNLDDVLVSHVKGQESMELLCGLADLAKSCLDMCGDNRPLMKDVADELNRLRKLSVHPWIRVGVETEAESLLVGESAPVYEFEQSTGYTADESEDRPINPRSVYYAR
ncbi:hypothetical protein ACQ4PT_030943 [Festuca glaucescens]